MCSLSATHELSRSIAPTSAEETNGELSNFPLSKLSILLDISIAQTVCFKTRDC